jgi:hypothetical protein
MKKRFLRLFKEYRDLERDLDRRESLVDSLERYVEALEGRDKERLTRIAGLEAENQHTLDALREAHETARNLRARLISLRPDRKEES